MSAHLHNFHNAPESDGGPCRYFFRGQYFDQYSTGQQAGFASTHQPNGDINESLSTLWYHDHRIDHTARTFIKGWRVFTSSSISSIRETRTDRLSPADLPAIRHPNYAGGQVVWIRVPVRFASTPLISRDCSATSQLANGIIQPFFNVSQRRYRFRVLNGGPSRFYELFLTDPLTPSTQIPFWVIAADGNLLPTPIQVTSIRLGVAERYDIIIDFNQVKSLIGSHTKVRLENRLVQDDGQGPSCDLFPPARALSCVEFRIGSPVTDNSVNPATHPSFYQLPSVITPRITRNFSFDRDNGQWVINDRFANCNELRFTVTQNSAENWLLMNPRSDWQHPIHIHLEQHQILSRSNNGGRRHSYSHHSRRAGLSSRLALSR